VSLSERWRQFWAYLPPVLYPNIALRDSEVQTMTLPANRAQNRRGVGGRLTITDQRVGFTPHRLEIGGNRWSCERSSVRRAWVEPKGKRLLDGSRFRERLGIATDEGSEFFSVADPSALARDLSSGAT
jgi:hypothetical protein